MFAGYDAGRLDDCATQPTGGAATEEQQTFSEEQDVDFLDDEALAVATQAAEAAQEVSGAATKTPADQHVEEVDESFWLAATQAADKAEETQLRSPDASTARSHLPQSLVKPHGALVSSVAPAQNPEVKSGPASAPVSPVSPCKDNLVAPVNGDPGRSVELDAGRSEVSSPLVGSQQSRTSRAPSPTFDSDTDDDLDCAATQAWLGEDDTAGDAPVEDDAAEDAPGQLQAAAGGQSVEATIELDEVQHDTAGGTQTAEAAPDSSSDDEDVEMAALFKEEAERSKQNKQPISILGLGSQDEVSRATAETEAPMTTRELSGMTVDSQPAARPVAASDAGGNGAGGSEPTAAGGQSVKATIELDEVQHDTAGGTQTAEAAPDSSSDDEDVEMAALFKAEAERSKQNKQPISILGLGSQDEVSRATAETEAPMTTRELSGMTVDSQPAARPVAASDAGGNGAGGSEPAAADPREAEALSVFDERDAPRVVKLGDPVITTVSNKRVLAVKWNTNEVFSEVTLALGRPKDVCSEWGRFAPMSERKNFQDKLVKRTDLKNRNGVHSFATGAVKTAAKKAEECSTEWGVQVPLYIDMYRGGFHNDGRNVGMQQGHPEFCSTRPFKIHLTEDGQDLLRVEMLQMKTLEAEVEQVRRKEQQELVAAQREAERLKELERAVPVNCALCGDGATEELGELLNFQVSKEDLDTQSWRAHRHCLRYCQTAMDSNGRGKHKKFEEHGMVAVKYVGDKKCITPGQAIKDCWAKKCSHCQERGAHLACHVPTCKKTFHLKCANAPENCAVGLGVAVCRDSTSRQDEETESYLMGHGPKDTFCSEHSVDRPDEEFAPIAPDKDSDIAAAAAADDDPASSSSEDEYDDMQFAEWLPEVKKRKSSSVSRSSPAQMQTAAAAAVPGMLVEVSDRWYRCVNQCLTRESCDPESDIKRNTKGRKVRVYVGDKVFAKQVRKLDTGQTRVECMRVKNGKKTRKNLGWLSLVSKSGNQVLVVSEPETATDNKRVAAPMPSRQQPRSKRKKSASAKAASSSQQRPAASEATETSAAAASSRVTGTRNLKPGVWQQCTRSDGRDGWTNLNQDIAKVYEAAWQAGKNTADYTCAADESKPRYITVDFSKDASIPGVFSQVDWGAGSGDTDITSFVRRRKRSKNEISVQGSAAAADALVVPSAPAAASAVASVTMQRAAAPAREKRHKMSHAKNPRADTRRSGASGGTASANNRYQGGTFLDDAPGGSNGSHATGVFSNVASLGPYGRKDNVYKPSKKRKMMLSSDEEVSEDESGFVVPDAAPIEVETIDLSTTGNISGRERDDNGDGDNEVSDDDFQTTGRAKKTETAERLRAVVHEAKANDCRDHVAAADHADMAAGAKASADRVIVAKCTRHACVCNKIPCVGGVNMEYWTPNEIRCRKCECCLQHRKSNEKGRLRWDPKIPGGCCSRAPTPCPHNDPKKNQGSSKLGNDESFMVRDLDESNFDDFAEPTSDPSDDERDDDQPANRHHGDTGDGARVSARRQNKEAQHRQNVSRLQRQMRTGSAVTSDAAPIMRPVVTKRTQTGFLRSSATAVTGSQDSFPAGYRPVHSPQTTTAQPAQGASAAASILHHQPSRGSHHGQTQGRAPLKQVPRLDQQARRRHMLAQQQHQAQRQQQQQQQQQQQEGAQQQQQQQQQQLVAGATAAAAAAYERNYREMARTLAQKQAEMDQQRQHSEKLSRELEKAHREKLQLQEEHAQREESSAEKEGDHICAICMNLVYEPAVSGCCVKKFCKLCLEQWKKEQVQKGKTCTCPNCRAAKPGPVVIDYAYWRLVQKLFPNAVNQRRSGMHSAHPGGPAGGSVGSIPNCWCPTPRPAHRSLGPVQQPSNPKHKGCHYWMCANRPNNRPGLGGNQRPHCRFWFWEEPGAGGAPAAAFTRPVGASGLARGQGTARTDAAPAARRGFF